MLKVLTLLIPIYLTGCSIQQVQEEKLRRSTISLSEQLLSENVSDKTQAEPIKNMRLEDYAKYRNANSAQRESRGVLVDNFIRGLSIGGF